MKFLTSAKIKFFLAMLLVLFIGSIYNADFNGPFSYSASVKSVYNKETEILEDEKIYSLTFEEMESTKKLIDEKGNDITGFPAELVKLNGKKVKITGNLLIPNENYYLDAPLSSFAVSKYPFGCPCCSWGPPPTLFNVVFVTMEDQKALKPPFSQNVSVTGVFKAEKKYYEKGKLEGLFFITHATVEKIKK